MDDSVFLVQLLGSRGRIHVYKDTGAMCGSQQAFEKCDLLNFFPLSFLYFLEHMGKNTRLGTVSRKVLFLH